MHVVGGCAAARRAADDHVVARLDVRRADPLLFEPARVCPLRPELARHARRVVGREVDTLMRTAELVADDVTFELDEFFLRVVPREGMMCISSLSVLPPSVLQAYTAST